MKCALTIVALILAAISTWPAMALEQRATVVTGFGPDADAALEEALLKIESNRAADSFVRAVSAPTYPTEAQASAAARREAARRIAVLVRLRASSDVVNIDAAWLESRTLEVVEHDLFHADQFIQRFDRPYASTYRVALIVDTPQSKLNRLATDFSALLRHQRSLRLQRIVSSLLGSALILALYFLLNTLTQGYFKSRLRFSAAMLLSLAMFIVWTVGGS